MYKMLKSLSCPSFHLTVHLFFCFFKWFLYRPEWPLWTEPPLTKMGTTLAHRTRGLEESNAWMQAEMDGCTWEWQLVLYSKHTLMLVERLRSLNMVFMSMRDCRTSRYTDPRKLRGSDNWNSSPFTITKSPTVIVPAHINSQQSSHLHKHTPNSHHASTNTLPTVRRVKLHQRVMLTLYCQNVSTFLHFFSRTNPTLHLLAQILLGLWEGICWELLGTKRVKGNNFASANTHTHTSTSNKHQLNTLFSNKNVEQYRWQSWPTWPIISIFLNLKENFCASYVHPACAAMDFSPRGQFSMQTITVSVQPMCTTACINMRTHIKILNAGNQTTVWIHENTAHTDRNR